MLYDGVQLIEGSQFTNLTVASGTSFPSNPSLGELFYRSDNDALHVYNGSAWDEVGSGGGGGTPGGSNTDIQYNNSGAFGGNASFTFDGSQTVDLGNFLNDGNAVLKVHGTITSGTDGGNATALTIRTANAAGKAPDITLRVGTSSGNNVGAQVNIAAGAEGNNGYGGGNVVIRGGSGYNGVNGYAGGVQLRGGVGSSAQGTLAFYTADTLRFTL